MMPAVQDAVIAGSPRPETIVSAPVQLPIWAPVEPMQSELHRTADIIAAEHVSLFVVDLPLRNPSQRTAAAGFAIEDLLATRLEDTHVVSGPLATGGRYLVAAVSHEVMRACTKDIVLAEQMLLPAPETDATWTARRVSNRVLIRTYGGAGFSASLDQMPLLWAAAGKPKVISYGAALPQTIPYEDQPLNCPSPAPKDLKFNLRSGAYSVRGKSLRRLKWAVTGCATLTMAIWVAALAWHVTSLETQIEERQASLRQALAQIAPGVPLSADGLAVLERAASAPNDAILDPFFPLFGAVNAGLVAAPSDLSIQSFDYLRQSATLTIDLRAGSIETLRAAAQALSDRGLIAELAAINRTEDGARSSLTVMDAP